MSLRDEHLLKALQNAPDIDVAPSDVTRKAVLDYADKALKPRSESRVLRVKNMFNSWQFPRWQMTGMGSLAASLLVVVMIWHENPDDPMQVASAPDAAQSEVIQSEAAPRSEQSPQVAASVTETMSAPVLASAEIVAPKAQNEMEEKAAAKTKSAKLEAEPQAAAIEAPSDKAIVASAPELASTLDVAKDAGSVRHKERAASNEAAPTPAPVAAAPEPVTESAPATAIAEASGDAMSKQAAPSNKSVKKMADAEAQLEAKPENSRPDNSVAAAPKPALARNISLAQTISKEGGKALANKDIQAGNLRILYLSKSAPAGAPLLDEVTGYRMEFIADDAANLAAEVAAYNQAMRDWHLNQNQ